MKKYRMDTPKGQVQCAFDTKGEDEALAIAKQHKISEARMRRWFKQWAAAPVVETRRAEARKEVEKSSSGFVPDYRYSSEAAARASAEGRVKINGIDPAVFLCKEKDGKWALIPRNLAQEFGLPKYIAPEFVNGERVESVAPIGKFGRVMKAGPEVCEIKWEDGREENVSTDFLRKTEQKAPAKAPRVTKELKKAMKLKQPDPKPVKKDTRHPLVKEVFKTKGKGKDK